MDLRTLVEQAKGGDQQAMGALYQQTCQRVYALALRLTGNKDTAMDVVQESYLSALEHLEDLRNPDAFLSWIFQIAANRCRKVQRQAGRLVSPGGEDEEEADYFDAIPDPNEALIPEAAADSGETRRLVMELVDSLPPEQRECVILYYFTQCPVEQIARVQGCAEGTVKSRLNYARKKLKEGVLALEARDNIRLHSLAPIGLLFACIGDELPSPAAFLLTWQNVAAGVGTAGTAAASAGAASAAAGQGAGAGAGAAAAGGSQAASGVSAAAKGMAGALKIKIAAGVAAAAVLAGGAGVMLHQPAVTFSDPVFEQNIRILLDKPTGALRESDLNEITVLRITDEGMLTDSSQSFPEIAVEGTRPVSSLADVALFPDLDILHCNTHDSGALLNTLTENETLHFISGGAAGGEGLWIEDLSFVERLPNLTSLSLAVAAGADLTPVEERESLRSLNLILEDGDTVDVSRLTGLYWLTLSTITGSDLALETSQELSQLLALELGGGTAASSLEVLSSTPSLELLDLYMVNPLDLTPVARLPHLRALQLNYANINNPPADLTPLLQSDSLEICSVDFLPEGSIVPPQLPVSIQEREQYWTILYEVQDRVNQLIREKGPA